MLAAVIPWAGEYLCQSMMNQLFMAGDAHATMGRNDDRSPIDTPGHSADAIARI
jgi:hypothetical protein